LQWAVSGAVIALQLELERPTVAPPTVERGRLERRLVVERRLFEWQLRIRREGARRVVTERAAIFVGRRW